jgi:hypothetical protein
MKNIALKGKILVSEPQERSASNPQFMAFKTLTLGKTNQSRLL